MGLGLGVYLGLSSMRSDGGFLPAVLFSNSELGVWYDPSGLTTLFQDTSGTTPVTTPGQTVGLMLDKSGNGLNATQSTAAARPSYIVDADGTFIQHDLVDDALMVTLPDMGTEATVAYVTRSEVRLLEDQTISGSYTLPKQEIAGFIAVDRALTISEKINVIRYLASKVEGVNYGAEIDRLTLIAINAVDVFVYDTSKDSDGGAWRTGALAQASSWYNETLNTATRGSRREFPAVAVIVAEADKVTIYDGDDPALPMWATYSLNNPDVFAVAALNGAVTVGNKYELNASYGGNGLTYYDFAGDRARLVWKNGSNPSVGPVESNKIISGNWNKTFDTSYPYSGARYCNLADYTINDVAMTVLPDAPVDPATGLPVPTIAVATAGGCSIIKQDGTVANSSTAAAVQRVEFADTSLVWCPALTPQNWWITDNIGSVVSGWSYTEYLRREDATGDDYPRGPQAISAGTRYANLGGNSFAISNTPYPSTGVFLYERGEAVAVNKNEGLMAKIMPFYNAGWMHGDIRGAYLGDIDATAISGGQELIPNGTFDTDASGWTAVNGTVSVSGGALRITAAGVNPIAKPDQSWNLAAGKAYRLKFDVVAVGDGSIQLFNYAVGNRALSGNGAIVTSVGSYEYSFIAPQSGAHNLFFQNWNGTTYFEIDNVSVQPEVGDYSHNNKGLIVNGTITRAPVADGAELVAYSGFSTAANFLEQPYNGALDFGTGDFAIMVWLDRMEAWRSVLSRGMTGAVSFIIEGNGTENTMRISTGNTPRVRAMPWFNGVWRQLTFVRRSGVAALYLDGVQTDSWSAPENVSVPDAPLFVGKNTIFGSGFYSGKMALLRISATAPTPDQIAKIYNDEKVLFEPNAQATLYGASDAVTALAHDPDTGLLHVGTSAGRSIFEGLRRVGNTTTSVSKAISASGGLIVEK